MRQTVGELIRDQECTYVRSDQSVREAVDLMVERDYSQLPVVDKRDQIVGIFTERKLTQAILLGLGCDVHNMSVGQWMESPAKVVSPNWSIYDVAHLLVAVYAVVVGLNGKPIGVVTDYDLAAFLAEWSQGIAVVEDIEKRLRGYIERVLPTPQALQAALVKAFGTSHHDESQPLKKYDELTLREHVQLITTTDNWPLFESYFTSKNSFNTLMTKAIPIRNQIAHFRGSLTHVQLATLEAARTFLAQSPRVPVVQAVPVSTPSEP